MRKITLGTAAINQLPLDWDRNGERIIAAIKEAKSKGVGVLCLPELVVSGYGCEDMFLSDHTSEMSLDVIRKVAPETKNIVVAAGLPLRLSNITYNAVCLFVDGKVIGFTCKQRLAGDGIHYEPRWFDAWIPGETKEITIDDKTYPVGDIYYDIGGLRLGFEICRDAWVENRVGRRLKGCGLHVMLNPSASHFAFGKYEEREKVVCEGSEEFGVTYAYANLLGNEAGRIIYDGSALIAQEGKIVARGPRFSFVDFVITTANLELKPREISNNSDCKARLVTSGFEIPDSTISPTNDQSEVWEQSDNIKEEEFSRAVSLGLFDYLRKSRANGFIVSLSGGADSTSAACLIKLMVDFAINEIGQTEFCKKLSYISEIKESNNFVTKLLTCVYQATRNSSDTTRQAAREVSRALKASFMELNVDPIVEGYTKLISESINEELTWEGHDVALQNIQARVRSPGIWLIANLKNALLLSTSNRSEAAVGYTTMDGDTSGGLNPIGGIDKAYLKTWLRWLETIGPKESGPIPELHFVTSQEPTAELRPPGSKQKDEADLMPYDALDIIERFAIRDKRSPKEVVTLAKESLPDYSEEKVTQWVKRFFQLFSQNQWKRERYAPSFHLDDENLDPKTWCRFPILSGGFAKELEEL